MYVIVLSSVFITSKLVCKGRHLLVSAYSQTASPIVACRISFLSHVLFVATYLAYASRTRITGNDRSGHDES